MSLGPAIDVGIGLIFVYLLLGLIVTALQEIVASALKWRGKQLRDTIAGLVAGGDKNSQLFQDVFGHVMVGGTSTFKLPSYVPSRNFALAVVDTLADGSSAPLFTQIENGLGTMAAGPVRTALDVLLKHAAGDLDALKHNLATWYDDAMDRVSGEYKRFSQSFAIIAGLVLAVGLNVNSIEIAKQLWTDQTLRANVTAAAQVLSQKQGAPDAKSTATGTLNNALGTLSSANLPIGWDQTIQFYCQQHADACRATTQVSASHVLGVVAALFRRAGLLGGIVIVLGWLITALATSLGAPFWFDMLKDALNLRGAGPKPPRADAKGAKP